MRSHLIGAVLLAALLVSPGGATPTVETAAGRYVIDAAASSFTVHVYTGGVFSFAGHDHTIAIKDFSGEASVPPNAGEPATLRISIIASSLQETAKDFSDQERQEINKAVREKALEVDKFPQILFQSTRVALAAKGAGQYQGNITGDLTLHGQTHSVTIPIDVLLSGTELRARGSFSIKHGDFNIKRISAAGGTVMAKEKMDLAFDIVARRQPSR